MSTMRQTVSTLSTRNANSDNNLDALLDDLQSTISRSGSQRGMNGSVTGYREIRRTVKDDATGESSTEYKIEYLHPANSTTHVTEMNNSDLNTSGYGTTGQNLSAYKEYKYNSSQHNTLESPRNFGGREERMKQNITAFDSLLDDINKPSTRSYNQLAISNTSSGIDSGLLEPVGSSGGVVERKYHEERREVRGTGPRRELVFTGPKSRDPSPISGYDQPVRPIRQEVYRYEKTTSTRTIGNDGNIVDGDGGRRGYTEDVKTVRSPSPQFLQYRDPSPSRVDGVTKIRDRSPSPGYGRTNQSYSYSSSSHHESRSDAVKTPPPHRSPSPVSFIQPPPPPPTTIRSSFRTTTNSYDQNYHQGVPQPKFTDPSPNRSYSPHHNVASYKYSSSSSNRYHEDSSMKPRPFPVPSPTPDQQPPKKLDDLMASFSDVQIQDHQRSEKVHHVQHTRSDSMRNRPQDTNAKSVNVPVERTEETKVEKKGETKNITGPPVYYPKGGDLFVKKEESMTQASSAGGGGKYKAKAKYQYESGSKYKESSDTKMIPVCVPCPCCCAAPCTIM